METIRLKEHEAKTVSLTANQAEAIATVHRKLKVSGRLGLPGEFELYADGVVGRLGLGNLSIVVEPKIPLSSLLFMLAYAVGAKPWRSVATVGVERDLLEAIALVFGQELTSAFSRGLVRDYRVTHASLPLLRGRVRMHEQVRRWFGRMPPVECEYDEFTEDILENRLILAALRRLRHVPIRNAQARSQLRRAEEELSGVAAVDLRGEAADQVVFTRLNDRLRRAVGLSRLILDSFSVTLSEKSSIRSWGFLLDVAPVFELFVLTALRDALRGSPVNVPASKGSRYLDQANQLRVAPDLLFLAGAVSVAVGDVKYKRTVSDAAKEPDVYQVLAYMRAFGTADAFLVYPRGRVDATRTHRLRESSERLHVVALDLDRGPAELLRTIKGLADAIVLATGSQRSLPPSSVA